MTEPVSLEEAKRQLRLEAGFVEDDALIAGYIEAAREYAEGYSGHILVRRQLTEPLAQFGPYVQLTRRPIVSVDAIDYLDADGATVALAGFHQALHFVPARVFAPAAGWPVLHRHGGAFVTYTAGYAGTVEDPVPRGFRQAILMMVAHWYSVREAVNIGNIVAEVPIGATALLDQHRVPSL